MVRRKGVGVGEEQWWLIAPRAYLTLTADTAAGGQLVTALILAALGAALGLWAWLWLVRHSEVTGYAQAPKRAYPDEDLRLHEGSL